MSLIGNKIVFRRISGKIIIFLQHPHNFEVTWLFFDRRLCVEDESTLKKAFGTYYECLKASLLFHLCVVTLALC